MKIAIRPLLITVLLLLTPLFSLKLAVQGDFAQNSVPIVRVMPSEVAGPDLTPSEDFTIAVEISDVTDLKGFDIQLRWNASLLDYNSHSIRVPVETYPDGVLHGPILAAKDLVNATLGTYWIAYATINGPSFNGSGIVFEMTFIVLNFGACPLDICFSALSNSTALPIDHLVEDGYFNNVFYDVAVVSVTPSSIGVTIGEVLNVTVVVLNNGTTRSETFDVTVYQNATAIANESVLDLPPHAEKSLKFQWDTSGMPPADYVMSANVTTVPDEARIGNNRLVGGVVTLVVEQIRDVAVTALTPFKTLIFKGYCVYLDVTVENQGNIPENVNITVYANNHSINNTQIHLGRNASSTFRFAWKAADAVEYEDYLLNATACPLYGEIDTGDNWLFLGGVSVVHPGDFDADEDVDIFDIVRLASAYGSETGDQVYDPNLDVNCDGNVDIFDVVMIAPFYGYEKA